MDTSLTANLTEDGRLINLLGGPRPDLSVPSVEPAVGARPRTRAPRGRSRAGAPARPGARPTEQTTEFANGDSATLVIYEGRVAPPRLASPRARRRPPCLRRRGRRDHRHARPPPEPRLRRDRVGVPEPPGGRGGRDSVSVNLDPYLDNPSTGLFGPTAHVLRHGDTVQGTHTPVRPRREQRRGRPRPRQLELPGHRVRPAPVEAVHVDPFTGTPGRQPTDRRHDLHWLIGNFHDHLENTPQIAFANAAGNFEDADRVVAQNVDGANTAGGDSRTKTTSTTRT